MNSKQCSDDNLFSEGKSFKYNYDGVDGPHNIAKISNYRDVDSKKPLKII